MSNPRRGSDLTVSADGNIRVDKKGNWNSAKRVSTMIEMFGGPRKRTARVVDVKGDVEGVDVKTKVAGATESLKTGVAGAGEGGLVGSPAVGSTRYIFLEIMTHEGSHDCRYFDCTGKVIYHLLGD